ncbi:Uma2 family endonuclease [Thiohalocapsa marina]|uniref:Uma2 family endonuclease n=1 Tax=Thiohalocapsa marina TaxID=424902 RepID=A0A5M8FSA0_9GAMM|nr:Uma2 family endonuclease [Thiohalocapsa marina]KAA6186951.1 Uma2 family endonuclease [Thiohalocapsa marina]
MSAQPKPFYRIEDWLADERAALETRSEYIDGEVFAMPGASEARNLIVTNISGELRSAFESRPCRVYANDMKVHIRAANEGRYPDLAALCGEREFFDGRTDLLLNPSLIVEVLSDSTEGYDRGAKFASYRLIPSLRDYLLISQHRMQAELYTRQSDGRWLLSDFSAPTDRIPLESVDCLLELAEVYDKVELPACSRQPPAAG